MCNVDFSMLSVGFIVVKDPKTGAGGNVTLAHAVVAIPTESGVFRVLVFVNLDASGSVWIGAPTKQILDGVYAPMAGWQDFDTREKFKKWVLARWESGEYIVQQAPGAKIKNRVFVKLEADVKAEPIATTA